MRGALWPAAALPAAPVLLLYTRFVEFPVAWPLRVLQALAARWPGLRLLVVGGGFLGEEDRLLARRGGGAGRPGDRLRPVPEADLGALLTLGAMSRSIPCATRWSTGPSARPSCST